MLLLNHSVYVAAGAPNIAELRGQFSSVGSGPYFRGYCGEHESDYQEITQLAGNFLGKPVVPYFPYFLIIWFTVDPTHGFDTHARNRARLDEECQRVRATILPLQHTSLARTRIRGRRNAHASLPSAIFKSAS